LPIGNFDRPIAPALAAPAEGNPASKAVASHLHHREQRPGSGELPFAGEASSHPSSLLGEN